MQHSQIITDYHNKQSIFTGEMHLVICLEWAGDHFVLVWHKSIHFWRNHNSRKHKQLSSTNRKSSFQSHARHFLAWNRTVF